MITDNRGARDGRAPTAGPELNAPRAKQGDRRSSTFWILFMAVILAAIVGVVLLSTTEQYTADRPDAAQEAPTQNATPTTPGQQAPPPQQ